MEDKNNLVKSLNGINSSLNDISLKLDGFSGTNNSKRNLLGITSFLGEEESKGILIKGFPKRGEYIRNGASVLQTEIVNFPEPQKDYLIFKVAKDTKLISRSLLTFSFLGILYGAYDIQIENLFGTSLKGHIENIPTVLFLLILIDFIFFIIYYYRDCKEYSLRRDTKFSFNKNTIKYLNDNINTLETRKKDLLLYVYYIIKKKKIKITDKEILNLINNKISKKYFKDYDKQNYDEIIDNNIINKIDKIILNEKFEKQHLFKYLKYSYSIIDKDILNYKDNIEKKEQEYQEYFLQQFNKIVIYIILQGAYPIFIGLIGLILLEGSFNIKLLLPIKKVIFIIGIKGLILLLIGGILVFLQLFFKTIQMNKKTKKIKKESKILKIFNKFESFMDKLVDGVGKIKTVHLSLLGAFIFFIGVFFQYSLIYNFVGPNTNISVFLFLNLENSLLFFFIFLGVFLLGVLFPPFFIFAFIGTLFTDNQTYQIFIMWIGIIFGIILLFFEKYRDYLKKYLNIIFILYIILFFIVSKVYYKKYIINSFTPVEISTNQETFKGELYFFNGDYYFIKKNGNKIILNNSEVKSLKILEE